MKLEEEDSMEEVEINVLAMQNSLIGKRT